MKNLIFLLSAFMVLITTAHSPAVQPDQRGPTPAVEEENAPEFVELFRVRVVNEPGGEMTISRDGGKTWEKLANVLAPAGVLNKEGYTASSWAPEGRVAATAVNAVHIKVRLNKTNGKGILLSLLPKDFYSPPEDYKSYYSKNSSIVVDAPAGAGFFGGAESPFIGSPVLLERNGGAPVPLPEDYYPEPGDALTIIVERPAEYPSEIEFENRFGGFITARYPGGAEKLIGQVLKPVAGVGRFDGSLYTGVGRLRANHTGVICISTSPPGVIGGFQILPENHGMSPEMANARLLTQWMVVGPPAATDPSLEGVAPLFRYFLRPVHFIKEAGGRTLDEMLESFVVEVRLKEGPWQRMPEVAGRVDDALKDLTHVRILFPLETPEWMK